MNSSLIADFIFDRHPNFIIFLFLLLAAVGDVKVGIETSGHYDFFALLFLLGANIRLDLVLLDILVQSLDLLFFFIDLHIKILFGISIKFFLSLGVNLVVSTGRKRVTVFNYFF